MGISFNPLTGELDLTGAGGSGPTVQTPNYVSTFTTGSFTGPGGGYYTFSIAAATHGKGLNPILQVWEDIGGGVHELVTVSHQIDNLGNITIRVAEIPDMRFNGKAVISENN